METPKKRSLSQPSGDGRPQKNIKLVTWLPNDDELLKNAVNKSCDLRHVYKTIRFSSAFTLQDISERWAALLYDANVSGQSAAKAATRSKVTKRVPWSAEEEARLRSETKRGLNFHIILHAFRAAFHPCRTPKSLEAHYYRMKRNGSLNAGDEASVSDDSKLSTNSSAGALSAPQNQENLSRDVYTKVGGSWGCDDEGDGSGYESFPSLESLVSGGTAAGGARSRTGGGGGAALCWNAESVTCHGMLCDSIQRRQWQQVITLERLLDREREREQDTRALAWLRSQRMLYAMMTRELMIGRATSEIPVDVDLSRDTDSSRVSRRHCILKLKCDGLFSLKNIGKRPVTVDGVLVPNGGRKRLTHGSLVEIGGIPLLFLTNTTLHSKIRKLLFTPGLKK